MHGVICKWFITPNTCHKSSVPDLDLQTLNDHGIYTIDETKELSPTVKLQLSALYLNTKSLLNQHFKQINSLLDSISILECSKHETDFDSFQIPDDRTFSTGGGVALYIK